MVPLSKVNNISHFPLKSAIKIAFFKVLSLIPPLQLLVLKEERLINEREGKGHLIYLQQSVNNTHMDLSVVSFAEPMALRIGNVTYSPIIIIMINDCYRLIIITNLQDCGQVIVHKREDNQQL